MVPSLMNKTLPVSDQPVFRTCINGFPFCHLGDSMEFA